MNVSKLQQPETAAVPIARRMSFDNLRKGKLKAPMRLLVYGGEKVGKSTFAAGAPSPIWLGKDSGTEHLDIERLAQPETWSDVLEGVALIEREGFAKGYRTLVIDPVTWLEPLAHLDVTGDPAVSIALWSGGYGKGYSAAVDRWRTLVAGLERVWRTGMNIILISHSQVKTFNDPEGPSFERYELALENKNVAGLLKQWVDAILFAQRESFGKVDQASKKTKAYGSAARMLHTEFRPAYDAGNRWRLPADMELSWSVFAEAVEKGERQVEVLLAQIEEGLRELNDPEITRRARAYLSDKTIDVAVIANAVAAKLGERRNESEKGKEQVK